MLLFNLEPGAIGALEKFLSYGPIGLAGLMLVLVVIALSFRELTPAKAGLLKFFMVVGAVCFLAALIVPSLTSESEHRVTVVVAPNDLGERRNFPPPIVRLNGERIDRSEPMLVASRSTIIIDVTDALGVYEKVEKDVQTKAQELASVESEKDALEADVGLLREDVEKREAQVVEANARMSSLNEDIARLKTETAKLETEAAKKDDALKTAIELNDQLSANVATLRREVTATPGRAPRPAVRQSLDELRTIQRDFTRSLGAFR